MICNVNRASALLRTFFCTESGHSYQIIRENKNIWESLKAVKNSDVDR
jgi:hypothetical protein